jgi:hypothetical protein
LRRAIFVTAIVVLVTSTSVPTATAGLTDTPRVLYYQGPTSEGGSLGIQVVVSGGVAHLGLLLIEGPYRCEDGTESTTENGVGWVGKRGPIIEEEHLDLSDNWNVIAFAVSGNLGSHQGSGTLTFWLPGFSADAQRAQVCTMGELTWSVERTAGDDFPFKPITTLGGGRRAMTDSAASEKTATARAEAGPIRRYHGLTSQRGAMVVRTQRTDAGIALLRISLGLVILGCEDGAEDQVGIRPLAYFDSTLVIPPGRLDVELAPTLGLGDVLNLNGELDAHAGAGTLSMAWSMLTEDLQAQLCTSGDLTWKLWRVDEGY